MRSTASTIEHGSPSALDLPLEVYIDMVSDLDALPAGRRFTARDGKRFIRTNLFCFGFCDLVTGHLCSARDICTKHGGVRAKRAQADRFSH